MASDLFTPILNLRTRSPNFFNGRLLTGEAMTDEQRAQRVVHELMTQAIGDGVAYGLDVTLATGSNTIDRPVVRVASGVAMNRCGEILLLATDTQVQLVRPADPAPDPGTTFRTCSPISSGTYVADAGLYLLTMTSIRSGNGLAQVSGLGDTPRSCNIKYIVDAVEFRLLELPLADELLANPNRLRNAVAYQCFGIDHVADFATDPFGTTAEPQTLLDQIRGTDLTDCDVPLAVLYWTATGGVQFVDMWAVRRRITHTRSAVSFPPASDVRQARAEAMVQQFQAQVALMAAEPTSTTTTAISRFQHLPPFGMVPVGATAGRDFSLLTFFNSLKTRGPFYVEGSRVSSTLDQALAFFPIDTASDELIWLYRTRENQQAIDDGSGATPRTTIFFVTGHAPWRGDAHYDISKWNYASYA
jgi:hypothetical protein